MSVNFNPSEMINILIVIVLFYILKHKNDVATLLWMLFVYGTLHFGFAATSLATAETKSNLTALHNSGGGVFAKSATILLLSVVFVLLIKRAYIAFFLNKSSGKKIVFFFAFVMCTMLYGYVLNFRANDWLQLKNVMSLEAMFFLMAIAILASNGECSEDENLPSVWWLYGLLILIISDSIAIYEVFTHSSWAGTLQSSGDMVYRASSILFNPNLLAFWASLVYLGSSYGLHAYKTHKKIMVASMVLVSIAIYFSGSRSSAYILFFVLFIPAFLIKKSFVWVPILVLPLTMLLIYAGATWLAPFFVASNIGWNEISLLGERFAATPVQLLNYVFWKSDSLLRFLAGFSGGVSIRDVLGVTIYGVPPEIVQSIEGRFTGGLEDSGWLVLYQDVGWVGLGGTLLACGVLFVSGVYSCLKNSNRTSVYWLAALLNCVLTGFVMRFQIFPVWLFIGLVVIVSLMQWRQSELAALRRGV